MLPDNSGINCRVGAGQHNRKQQTSKEPDAGQLQEPGTEFDFSALSDRYFEFSSGAGGWSTDLRIESLSERIAMEISFAEERSAELEAKLQEDTTQTELNIASAELFQTWDDTLNIVWKLLESELDEERMTALREEEREWIAGKEAAVKEAGQKYEGGSMQAMEEALKAAELTKERVRELAGYAE